MDTQRSSDGHTKKLGMTGHAMHIQLA